MSIPEPNPSLATLMASTFTVEDLSLLLVSLHNGAVQSHPEKSSTTESESASYVLLSDDPPADTHNDKEVEALESKEQEGENGFPPTEVAQHNDKYWLDTQLVVFKVRAHTLPISALSKPSHSGGGPAIPG